MARLGRVEDATLGWGHWYDTERLMTGLGSLPPAEFAAQYQAVLTPQAMQPAA